MRARPNPAEALVLLPQITVPTERRAAWRQAITALGRSVEAHEPPLLDGVSVEVLECALEVALASGLVDDLDWITPGSAAVALYEILSALPPGRARREIARRVFARLYEGTAATFAIVATRMAMTSARPLETPTLRARVSLVFDLPIDSSVNPDALALTLVLRAESRQTWMLDACTGALPQRRLAAKLLEHAAREAAHKADNGDPEPHTELVGEALRTPFRMLLGDREPLVWRHAAVARGLLSPVDSALREEIDLALDPSLSPTEWRRAVVSLVACAAADPDNTLKQCRSILFGSLSKLDPGLAATMVLGLGPVMEAEPDAAEELLSLLATTRRPDVAEAAAHLVFDMHHPNFDSKALRELGAILAERARGEGSVLRDVAARAVRALSPERDADSGVSESVRRAVLAYETTGARAAFELAQKAAESARRSVDFIAAQDPHDPAKFSSVLGVLADLDASTLETTRLPNLLLLGRRPGETDANVPEVERLRDRLANWVLDGEQQSDTSHRARDAALANQRRLRVLLHLVDLDTARSDQDAASMRSRVHRTLQVLLERLAGSPDALVHRIACATLARSFDAAVREGVFEASDLLLATAMQLHELRSLETIAEASTAPEVASALGTWARFVSASSLQADTTDTGADAAKAPELTASRVVEFGRSLSASGAYRAEALRETVLKLGRSVESIARCRGLSELVGSESSRTHALAELEQAMEALRKLIQSAWRRVLGNRPDEEMSVPEVDVLSTLIERAVQSGGFDDPTLWPVAVEVATRGLPAALADAIRDVLVRLTALPIAAKTDVFAIPLERRRATLPDWLLPRRTIGAFYVVRALGAGGVSSVFAVRRTEERKDAEAETFALKVPEYDPTTARSVSEQQFLELFKEEASALLSLPHHPNLARFVTFDLAARPKPILVMELIPGTGLDRLIHNQSLTTERVLGYLDGVLAGLEAMHAVGVGHLDVKPSNVILRDASTPVLVDFGLSGRKLRPGCGTLEYCAPEVLGVVPDGYQPLPMASDLYAFACLAFELFTGELLFSAEDEMALVSLQIIHDGMPDKLRKLSAMSPATRLSSLLGHCLRRDPRNRPSASDVRRGLRELKQELRALPWPLAPTVYSASA